MLTEYISRHIDWSKKTFGEGRQTEKILNHISKELNEIKKSPEDLAEWIDVIILSIDGAWRMGYSPVEIINELIHKQAVNFERKWVIGKNNEPNEHNRGENGQL